MPIANRRAEIQGAIAANQVVIVCGETGSGKTTQLPKICESDIDVEMISVEVFEGKCKEEAFAKLNRNG